MPPYAYPKEVHEFIKEWALKLRDQELAAACNEKFGTSFTKDRIKSFRYNHGYKNGMGKLTSEEYWKYQTRYPQGMYEFIRDNSWGVSSKKMAEMVNEKFGTQWTATGMKQFRTRHGIKSGETGWFRKGRSPGNKGKKLEEYIKDPDRVRDIRERISATQFKKGNKPPNELPLGTVLVNSNGYKIRKKQMEGSQWERWEFLHRAIWEEHYGPIPEGNMIIFKDNNRLNCDISNLTMITRAENTVMTKKKLRSEDPDLTMTGLNLVRLQQSAKKIKEDRKKNESRTLSGSDSRRHDQSGEEKGT